MKIIIYILLYMSSTVQLNQDIASNLSGVNLKWVNTNLAAIREVSLIYFKNSSDADIASIDVPSGLLKYNLSSGFTSGQSYSFQLQVVDINGLMAFSNTLVLSTPWFLAAPVISSVTGQDSALVVQLAPTTNIISASDTTVEFILKRDDNYVFWIIQPYASSGQYFLSSSDNPSLTNNVSYRIGCMFQPTAYTGSTRYSAPSVMSASVSATPSNIPNIPGNVSVSSVGSSTLDVAATWTRPSDFAEWSSNFTVTLALSSSAGTLSKVFNNQDVTTYTWTNVDRGWPYAASVTYSNSFGIGPTATSAYVIPTSIPDAPLIISAADGDTKCSVSWQAPTFTGQSSIMSYKIFRNGAQVGSTAPAVTSFIDPGLMNGYTYDYQITAVNSIGPSVTSGSLRSIPFGLMSIVSVVASGKTLTTTLNPNGRPVVGLMMIALDNDPDALDGDFVVTIPQQQISQVTTQNISVIKTFSTFNSDIKFYCSIAHNETGSVFVKSS
jgi:P pilus assembly chaperone PapD